MYTGDQTKFSNEFGKYQREGWQAYQHEVGTYTAPTLNEFQNRDEQVFVLKNICEQIQLLWH